MRQYAELTVNLVFVLAGAGGLFLLIAAFVRQTFGPRAVWGVWAVVVPGLTAACVFKLSGLASGPSFRAGIGAFAFATLFIVMVGVPLAMGGLVLNRLAARQPPSALGIQLAAAWGACIAAAPVIVMLLLLYNW
jgi:hypothetical protein